MSAIGPGDWVECLGRHEIKSPMIAPAQVEGRQIRAGGLYRVRRIFIGRYTDGSRSAGLMFEGTRGFNAQGVEGGWPVEMFRPIYRPDESLTTRLMEPLSDALAPALPERVSEPATAR